MRGRTSTAGLLGTLVAVVGCGFVVGPLPGQVGGSSTGGPSSPGTSTASNTPSGSAGGSGRQATGGGTTGLPPGAKGSTSGGETSGSFGTTAATGGSGPPPVAPGDCCVANDGPRCDDPAIASCVCGVDPYCCDRKWDALCVQLVGEAACGDCPGDGSGSQSCCTAHPAAGCSDAGVAMCVCALDPVCCSAGWDSACVDEAEASCGGCGYGTMDAGCCMAGPSAGCSDPAVGACVCAQDPYCCDVVWDDVCAGEVTSLGCGGCGGGTSGGTGASIGSTSGDGSASTTGGTGTGPTATGGP